MPARSARHPDADLTQQLTDTLARAGFVAATDEATELLERAEGDPRLLQSLVERRLAGEPLAWVVGRVHFCGLEIVVHPGVYVPRWQTEELARRAAARLPPQGVAVDLCTGSGAIAAVLMAAHPGARILATDADARAVACATANGVAAYEGDLFAALPAGVGAGLAGLVDVVVAVVPYVPTPALGLLPRDTFAYEETLAYDGGPDGTDTLRRVVTDATRYLRPAGALLLELGGDQGDALSGDLERLGYRDVDVMVDEEGDVRALEATYTPTSGGAT